jgi:hypothetical protein
MSHGQQQQKQQQEQQEKNQPEDHLEQDTPVPGQNWVCLSFISPENVLETKERFFLKQFWHNITQAGVDLNKVEQIDELYETFLDEHQNRIEEEFNRRNDFRTSVRGLKVRGVYNTQEEANVRCQVLQRMDRAHNVYVAPVGFWLPWDPSPNRIEDHEYLEPELNELMKRYKDNSAKRDLYYEEQKRERQQKAYEENEARRKANEAEAAAEAAAEAGAGEAAGSASAAGAEASVDEPSATDLLESMRAADVMG